MLTEGLTITRRKATYWGTFLFLFGGHLLLRRSSWQGDVQLHTLMELAATILALSVGILALIRFYSRKDNTFLLIGSGFLGTGFLDGYHAVVTSTHFMQYFPSSPPSLVVWSWFASRIFLSIMLWLSWLFWKRESRLGEGGRVNENRVYLFAGLFTLTCFLFFALAPLPSAYQPHLFFSRPQELVPALFFLLALIGYVRKGQWKSDAFEHWLVISLIVGFMSQVMFMSFSGRLYDFEFDAAHLLKKLSYICTLIGLLVSMYSLFQRTEKDIATIREVNDALKQSEGRYRSVVDNIGIGVSLITPGMEVLSLNRQMRTWFPHIDVSTHPVCYKAFNTPPRDDVCVYCPTVKTLQDGAFHESITETPTPQGIVNYRVISSPIRDSEGKVKAAIEMVEDITERKRWEDEIRRLNQELEVRIAERTKQLLDAQDELVRKEKLSILGQLSGSVGHELRNPLGVMSNAVYFLKMVHADGDETTREYLDMIKTEIDTSLRIITDLLEFARTGEPQTKTVTARQLLDESLAKCVIPENVELHADLPDILPMLTIDPMQMVQVFQNLITNAVQAMPEGGPLRISARRVLSSEFRVPSSNMKPEASGTKTDTDMDSNSEFEYSGSYSELITPNPELYADFVEISVEDTGEGISPENMKKIFQPLFTTKAKGIGLGLVVCRNLMEANGGTIMVESELGKGAIFRVILPIAAGQ